MGTGTRMQALVYFIYTHTRRRTAYLANEAVTGNTAAVAVARIRVCVENGHQDLMHS